MTDVLDEQATYRYPHVVRAALDHEAESESGSWRLADALYEDVGEAVTRETPGVSGVKTGLYARIEEAYLEAKRAGAHEFQPATLIRHYSTARAWPPETRIPQASFTAHRDLVGVPNRQAVLAKLAQRSSDGWVSYRDVRLWKSSRRPTTVTPFLEQIERGLRNYLLAKGQPWDRMRRQDREAIVRMLRQVAAEIQTEEFGR